jgi:putative hydrolase of the HAD superfamily
VTLPQAISHDLDDTLWPIWPAIERAERALHAFLESNCPRTAARFPVLEMRALRDRIAGEYPQHAHDFTRQRRLSLEHALRESGDDAAHVEAAFNAFYDERNRIEFYPDALDALARLARAPHEVLHVGDDPWLDVAGAHAAGLRTAWINRRDEAWPVELAPPELTFPTLAALADWLGAPAATNASRVPARLPENCR